MKKNYSFYLAILTPIIWGLFFAGTLYHNGSPGSKTGSPGDNGVNCTACHTGAPNEVSDWISSDIPELGYVLGETYTITATGTHIGVGRFGFELTSEDEAGTKVGEFIVSGDGQTQLVNGNKSITHTSSGITPEGDSKVWTFQWTAPTTDVGEITFYGAFNATNNNGNSTGDVVYLSSLSSDESTAGIDDIVAIDFVMSPNPSYGNLSVVFDYNNADISIFDLNGRLILHQEHYVSGENISLSQLNKGVYIVRVQNDQKYQSQKLVIK